MNLKILLTLAITLVSAWALFHFKAYLGIFILPIFIALVSFVTLRLYRLIEKEKPEDE